MKIKEFNNLRQMKKYFNKKDNTYHFRKKNGAYFDIKFNFNVDIGDSRIDACNIMSNYDITASVIKCINIDAGNIRVSTLLAYDVKIGDIKAHHIEADYMRAYDVEAYYIDVHTMITQNIKAARIDYLDFCIAIGDIRYEVVESHRRGKSIMRALDGKCIVEKYKKEVKNESGDNT